MKWTVFSSLLIFNLRTLIVQCLSMKLQWRHRTAAASEFAGTLINWSTACSVWGQSIISIKEPQYGWIPSQRARNVEIQGAGESEYDIHESIDSLPMQSVIRMSFEGKMFPKSSGLLSYWQHLIRKPSDQIPYVIQMTYRSLNPKSSVWLSQWQYLIRMTYGQWTMSSGWLMMLPQVTRIT